MNSPKERIRAGQVTLALDTNAMFGAGKRLTELCNRVNLLNAGPNGLNLRLCVPAIVHMEMLLDIRQRLSKKGTKYDASVVDRGLQDKGLHVVAFEKRHSERSAQRIAERFSDIDAWREAKRLLYVKSLGLTDSEELKKKGKRYSATVDWLIAAQASQEGWILVTNDKGDEFADIELTMSLNALEELLDELIEHRQTKGTS